MINKIILMYHSISSHKIPAIVGSFPIEMDRFKYQINSLKALGYKFDFISNLHKPISEEEKYIYITADDGTVDYTKNVLPWCEQNKIPTHTGIVTGPFEEVPIYPLTHLIQIILSVRSQSRLMELSDTLKESYLSKADINYIDKIYHYEIIEYRRIIKGSFNLILDHNDAYKLTGSLTQEEKTLLKMRFEDLEYYKQFNYAEVGVHTRRHLALGKDSKKYVEEEIEQSRDFLIANGLNPSKYYVSPMKPKEGSSLDDISSQLRSLGYLAILDSNSGVWDNKSYIIPRIDAKNIEEFFNL